jgi:hypothetical protein
MSSIPVRFRQNSPSHFMTLSSLQGLVYAYNPTAGALTFSTASFAWGGSNGNQNTTAGSQYLSSIVRPGALLRDIGKNIVSSNRYFRKIQIVVPNVGPAPSTNASTFGVAGNNLGTNPNQDYLTGYIELGYEGGGLPAPIVQFGGL